MKKKLLFTSFVIASVTSANAQITLTSTVTPVANNSYITANDTTVTSYGTSGANQTWNFAAWSNDILDTAEFVNPSTLTGASDFPTATLGIGDVDFSMFLKVSSTAMEILGFNSDFGSGPLAFEYVPAQKFLTFPSTYQTTFAGTSTYNITVNPGQMGLDSIKIKSIIYTESVMDGWGTLTTPSYTGVSSLRQNYTETRTDSTWGLLTGQTTWTFYDASMDTSHTYRWWSNAHNYPVAEVTFSEGDSIYNGNYLTATLVGVNETAKQKNNVAVFPNPATNKVNITGVSSESTLIVFDQNGKLVEQSRLGKNNNSINTANFNNGLYFYNIVPVNGSTVTKGKFVITK